MGESEFLAQAEAALNAIEAALDRLNDEDLLDVECSRSGNVLEIEFIDNGSKIIVNSQAAMSELWGHYAAAVINARIPYSAVRLDRGRRLAGTSRMNLESLVFHGLSAVAVYQTALASRILTPTVW